MEYNILFELKIFLTQRKENAELSQSFDKALR